MGGTVSFIHTYMSVKGGAARAVTDFACGMSSKKMGVCVVGDKIHPEWQEELQQKNVEMHSINTSLGGIKRWALLNYYIRKTENLIPASSELVIPCSFPATVAATEFKKKNGVPCVYYCFEPYRLFHDKEVIDSLSRSSKLFFKAMSQLYQTDDIEAAYCTFIVCLLPVSSFP